MEVGGIREGGIVPDPCNPVPVADVCEREGRILLRVNTVNIGRGMLPPRRASFLRLWS